MGSKLLAFIKENKSKYTKRGRSIDMYQLSPNDFIDAYKNKICGFDFENTGVSKEVAMRNNYLSIDINNIMPQLEKDIEDYIKSCD